jgi:Holliday junction DNA helicase RuvB
MNENLDQQLTGIIQKNLISKKLRPLSFDDFAGQDQILENLKVLLKQQIRMKL